MEHAKRNLVEKYLLVGITEEIGDFIAILEATVPRIFKGATKLFTEGRFSLLQCDCDNELDQPDSTQHDMRPTLDQKDRAWVRC